MNIGRVGGLAVALGIGAALASVPGLAAAEQTALGASDLPSNHLLSPGPSPRSLGEAAHGLS
jgi:hypothetical protein